MLLNLLPEDKRSRRLQPRCIGSARTFIIVFNQSEIAMSSKKRTRGQSLILCASFIAPYRAFLFYPVQPEKHMMQYTTYSIMVQIKKLCSSFMSSWHFLSSLKKWSLCWALLTTADVLVDHVRSSPMCTHRNLKEELLSTQSPFISSENWTFPLPPSVHHHILSFTSVQ